VTTQAQLDLYESAGELLRAAFGSENVHEAQIGPAHNVSVGRVAVRVAAEPIGDVAAVLELSAWIARSVEVTEEVAAYLAQRNRRLRFSALAVNEEGAIILQHSLFPESVAEPVVSRLVRTLAKSADALDEELRARFGAAGRG
jgi:type III secretion system-like peptide-binding chaperone